MAKIKCSKCGTAKFTRPDRLAKMTEEVKAAYLCRACRPAKVTEEPKSAE